MEHNEREKPTGSGRAAPLLLSLLLLLAIGAALYMLYRPQPGSGAEDPAALQAARDKAAALSGRKADLEKLAGADPCAIRSSLGLPPKTAPAGGAAGAPPGSSGAPPQGAAPGPAAPAAPPAGEGQASPPAPPPAAAPQQISRRTSLERVEDATVFVLNFGGKGISTGSGFFIAPDLVLTNRHVAGEKGGRIFVINRKLGKPVEAVLAAASAGERKGGRDYAVLRVPAQSAIAPLALRGDPRRADKVNAWGYPHAVSQSDPKYQALMSGQLTAAPELVYSDGAISAVLERDPPLIAHTAPLSQGNSGGPLTDENGMVVGINTLISLDDASYRQTSLALPASDIAAFLRQHGIKASLAR